MWKRGNQLNFRLENHSSNPAYDVDVWLIGVYNQETIPYKSLVQKKYVKEIKIDFKNSLFPEEQLKSYGITDRSVHYGFPPKMSCSYRARFYKLPDTVFLVIQFKDALGKNYLYQTILFQGIQDDSLFKKIYMEYSPFKSVGRINVMPFFKNWKKAVDHVKFTSFFHVFKLLCSDIISRIRKHKWINKEIRDVLKRIVPGNYQKETNKRTFFTEDRGKFSSI